MFDRVGPMPIFRGDLFGPNQTLNVLLVDCSTEVQNSPLLGLGVGGNPMDCRPYLGHDFVQNLN